MKLKFGILISILLAIGAWAQNPPGPLQTTQLQQPLQTLPAPVSSAAVSLVGNPGPQTIYYWIVANYLVGSSSPAGPFAVINAPNTLSSGNYINIAPTYPSGVVSIDILKTLTPAAPAGACNCAVAIGVTAGTVADQSNSTSTYTVGTVNVNALTVTLQNEPVGANQSHAILRQNGKFVSDLSTHGSGGPTGPAGGDLYGTYPNPWVGGINQVPLCTGFTQQNGYGLQYTTSSSPNPCYTSAPFASFLNPMTTLGDMISGGTAGVPTRLPGPTAPNNVTQVVGSQPSGGVATAPLFTLPGIIGRSVTGATDTIGSADCNPYRVAYTGSAAVAVALPTPATLLVPNCTVKLANNTSNTVTITPATWTISAGSGGTPGASLSLLEGQAAILFVDPVTSNNWAVDVVEQSLSASSPIVATRSPTGVAFSCPTCGTGTGNLSGTLTSNYVPKATGANTLGNSTIQDDGTHSVTGPNGFDIITTGWINWHGPNNGTVGTVLNELACGDGSGNLEVCQASTSTTNVPLGISANGLGVAPGTTGSTGMCTIGFCTVLFDNSATANHFAQESSSTNGYLSDVGATKPTNGQPFYFIYAGNAGAGTTGVIRNLTPDELTQSSSGGGGSKTTIQINGTAVANGNVLNINSTTPAAPAGSVNITLQTSTSGKTTSASGYISAPLVLNGIIDGHAPVTLTTSASCSLGTASGCNATAYSSGYTFNQEATAAQAVTYTLPTAAAGLQYCIANSYNGSAPTTGILTLATSAAGQFIIFSDGTLTASGGNITSGGAAGDAACVVGLDGTHWQLYVQAGTWTKH